MEFCGKCLAAQRIEWSPDRAGRCLQTRSGSGESVKGQRRGRVSGVKMQEREQSEKVKQ